MVDRDLTMDARQMLEQLCQERGQDYASLSRLIGRNSAYIHQFIKRGTPRRLPEQERRLLPAAPQGPSQGFRLALPLLS